MVNFVLCAFCSSFRDLITPRHGIGDDAHIFGNDCTLLFTMIAGEDIHFIRSKFHLLIWDTKLNIIISDIAAMGAKPLATFLSIAIPAM
jgi:thiamine-monophosphate kinase